MTDNGAGGSGVMLCHACQKPVRFASTNIEHLDGSSLCIEPEPLKNNHHLPECWAKHESDPPAWCICDELRACEERVLGDRDELVGLTAFRSFRAGLDAAREAVEVMDLHGCHPYRFPDCDCLGPQVIAAIDALREGSNG